nr:hypothetical protein [Tanacetum cinerariifolium]
YRIRGDSVPTQVAEVEFIDPREPVASMHHPSYQQLRHTTLYKQILGTVKWFQNTLSWCGNSILIKTKLPLTLYAKMKLV